MEHDRVLKRIWVLPILVAVLVAAHAGAVYGVLSHKTWTVALGLFVLVLLIHIGVLGPIYALFRRLLRHNS